MTKISSAIERLESVLARRVDFGHGTDRSVTTLADGLRCTSAEGAWRVESDVPPSLGGDGSAPTPGVLVRASLGACLAMMYRLRAERHGIALTLVRVTVETDSEVAGMLLCGGESPPGYTQVRYHVDIESNAPADEVLRILDEGDQLSPMLDVFNRSATSHRTTSIRTPAV